MYIIDEKNLNNVMCGIFPIGGVSSGGGAQWANSGGQAQTKESTELASYTPTFFCKESLRSKIFMNVRNMGFLAVGRITRPKIEKNVNFSVF